MHRNTSRNAHEYVTLVKSPPCQNKTCSPALSHTGRKGEPRLRPKLRKQAKNHDYLHILFAQKGKHRSCDFLPLSRYESFALHTPRITKKSMTPPPQSPPPTHKTAYHSPPSSTSIPTMPLKHVVTYQAFRKITNFIRDNGNDWDKFCSNNLHSTRKAKKTLPSRCKVSKHKTAKTKGHLAPEPLLQTNSHHFVLFSIQHNDIWRMYKKAEASFWTAKEIDLSADTADWNRLLTAEQHFISHVLAFFCSIWWHRQQEPQQQLCHRGHVAWSPMLLRLPDCRHKYPQWDILTPNWYIHQRPHQEDAPTMGNQNRTMCSAESAMGPQVVRFHRCQLCRMHDCICGRQRHLLLGFVLCHLLAQKNVVWCQAFASVMNWSAKMKDCTVILHASFTRS